MKNRITGLLNKPQLADGWWKRHKHLPLTEQELSAGIDCRYGYVYIVLEEPITIQGGIPAKFRWTLKVRI